MPFSAFRVLSPPQDYADSLAELCNSSDTDAEPDSPLSNGTYPGNRSVPCVESSPESSIHAGSSVAGNSQDQVTGQETFTVSLQLSIPQSIRAENRIDPTWANLFHVYLNVVAPTLVPVHEARNPWLRYPAIALHLSFQEGRNHLLYALLAHAAFCLSHKMLDQERMLILGTNLHSSAMSELRACIQEGSTDYLGLLTTILTFVLAEVFSLSYCLTNTEPFANRWHSWQGEVPKPGDVICRLRGSSFSFIKTPKHGQTRQMHGTSLKASTCSK